MAVDTILSSGPVDKQMSSAIVNFTQIIYTIPAPKAKLIAFGVKLEAMEKFTSERQYTLSLSLVKGNIHYLFH